MGFIKNILKHKDSEIDGICYELVGSLRNLLEVHTPSGIPDRASEEDEAVYRGRTSLRIAMEFFKKKNWFADNEDED